MNHSFNKMENIKRINILNRFLFKINLFLNFLVIPISNQHMINSMKLLHKQIKMKMMLTPSVHHGEAIQPQFHISAKDIYPPTSS